MLSERQQLLTDCLVLFQEIGIGLNLVGRDSEEVEKVKSDLVRALAGEIDSGEAFAECERIICEVIDSSPYDLEDPLLAPIKELLDQIQEASQQEPLPEKLDLANAERGLADLVVQRYLKMDLSESERACVEDMVTLALEYQNAVEAGRYSWDAAPVILEAWRRMTDDEYRVFVAQTIQRVRG